MPIPQSHTPITSPSDPAFAEEFSARYHEMLKAEQDAARISSQRKQAPVNGNGTANGHHLHDTHPPQHPPRRDGRRASYADPGVEETRNDADEILQQIAAITSPPQPPSRKRATTTLKKPPPAVPNITLPSPTVSHPSSHSPGLTNLHTPRFEGSPTMPPPKGRPRSGSRRMTRSPTTEKSPKKFFDSYAEKVATNSAKALPGVVELLGQVKDLTKEVASLKQHNKALQADKDAMSAKLGVIPSLDQYRHMTQEKEIRKFFEAEKETRDALQWSRSIMLSLALTLRDETLPAVQCAADYLALSNSELMSDEVKQLQRELAHERASRIALEDRIRETSSLGSSMARLDEYHFEASKRAEAEKQVSVLETKLLDAENEIAALRNSVRAMQEEAERAREAAEQRPPARTAETQTVPPTSTKQVTTPRGGAKTPRPTVQHSFERSQTHSARARTPPRGAVHSLSPRGNGILSSSIPPTSLNSARRRQQSPRGAAKAKSSEIPRPDGQRNASPVPPVKMQRSSTTNFPHKAPEIRLTPRTIGMPKDIARQVARPAQRERTDPPEPYTVDLSPRADSAARTPRIVDPPSAKVNQAL
eukprot:Sspe_Gene.12915::Locus_4424_Transcript_1_1_Confidence_1.000_Length_1938::g.12915::m.12915